jgi:hypothetical protein
MKQASAGKFIKLQVGLIHNSPINGAFVVGDDENSLKAGDRGPVLIGRDSRLRPCVPDTRLEFPAA